MRSVVDAGEVLEIKVGVDLGRADVGVAQQFLHGAQVLRRFQQVRRERVPEHVRMHVLGQSLQPRPARDAPLDDANIDKFNNIIKKFSKDSQFIIITHNKRTMTATDIIYGITMVEAGVTQVVPVDLTEVAEA